MAIQAREMVRRGDLGNIRVVVAEFALGAHAGGNDDDNPRIRWRYDPAQAGISSVVNDLGSHAFQMAEFVTGQKVQSVAAHFDYCVPTRKLEDDAFIACRFSDGAVGRFSIALWQVGSSTVSAFEFLAPKARLGGIRNFRTSYTGHRLLVLPNCLSGAPTTYTHQPRKLLGSQ